MIIAEPMVWVKNEKRCGKMMRERALQSLNPRHFPAASMGYSHARST
jgi:hypothetical protein